MILAIFLVLLLFNVVALAIELMILIVLRSRRDRARRLPQPWIVFAARGPRLEWPVVGYFNSRRGSRDRGADRAAPSSSPRRATGDDWMIDVVVCP